MDKYEYTIEKSSRKTMAVVVKGDGSVVIKAPKNMPDYQIERFYLSKKEWVDKAVKKMKQKSSIYIDYGYEPGQYLPYFGGALKVEASGNNRTYIQDGTLYLAECDNKRDRVIRVLKADLKKYIDSRLPLYAEIMGVQYKNVKIGSAKTRWGSCSGDNNLNFSYRLCMCPEFIIDYILVHELAHIKHHDHSKSFWNFVASIMPDYKIRKKWLSDNSAIMMVV